MSKRKIEAAPANTGSTDPLPNGWPKYGTFDGVRIDLLRAKRTMRPTDLAKIVVVVPGIGECQPWKQSDYGIASDGSILL